MRNEESCENGGGVVGVPVVVEPVVVRDPATVVPVQVANVEVATSVAVRIERPPNHCP